MYKNVQAILDILNGEIAFYKKLLKLSKDKQKIIIAGNVNELDKIIKIEQDMILEIGQLEKQRELEADRLCVLLGLKRESLTLSELSRILGASDGALFQNIQKEMKDLLSELKKINDQNGELIKQSLEYIDFSIDIITSSQLTSSSLYDEGSQTKRMFDAKA